jgi:hypothetical protein
VSQARSGAVRKVASAGVSRSRRKQAKARSTAGTPVTMKIHRQPDRPRRPSRASRCVITGVPSPEMQMNVTIHDIAMPRRALGNQRETRYSMPGEKPASATPSRKRMTARLDSPWTNAVAIVTRPQVTMIREIHFLAPTRVSTQLLGGSQIV